MSEKRKKHVHIIGICGVTMAPLGVLYKSMGWRVTGSDRAFFPPMSTYLEENGIKIMPGFKKEHIEPTPDLVLVMAFITEKNPEIIEAKRKKIPVKVYADVLPELIERENSIVIAGDCGKTSTTALITWVLEKAGYNPNFMIGGLPKNFEHGIRRTDSQWSVMEGDEYVASSWDNTPRFLYYNPKYLILTDIQWDHMDKYPSKQRYITIFEQLVRKVPKDGLIVAHRYGENVEKVAKKAHAPVLFYSDKDSRGFSLPFKGGIWRQNSAAAIVLARHLKISDTAIKDALQSFEGVKRRQEVRFENKHVVVIDDNAHTPTKVRGALGAISETFPGHALVTIYEPGNRTQAALRQVGYAQCFKQAHTILLPRVSAVASEIQNFNQYLARHLQRYYKDCRYIEDDSEIVSIVKKIAKEAKQNKEKIAVVFMSQKGFRGMIEEVCAELTP